MKKHASTLVTHFGLDHPDFLNTIYTLADLNSFFLIVRKQNQNPAKQIGYKI